MNTSESSERELERQVELLGSRDWRVVEAAFQVLVSAGDPGMEAAIRGLAHPHPRVRRGCAEFMDHHGDDRCVVALLHAARHDPIAYVRRVALHSYSCQRCKASPLQGDMVAPLIEHALSDANKRVRCVAIYGLGVQPPDARAAAALKTILEQETDRDLRRAAHEALQRHDPAYRQATIEKAKARARAMYESKKARSEESPAPVAPSESQAIDEETEVHS
jgi:HEAT repeat protein